MPATPTKKDLERPIAGLFFMTIFTIAWTLIAAFHLQNIEFWIDTLVFAVVILVFLFYSFQFNRTIKTLPDGIEEISAAEAKRRKWFSYVFIAEGLAILIVKNVLVNINHDEYFIPCFALIVGLHFFPLAWIFNRKFDYYLATWTTMVAMVGIWLTSQGNLEQDLIIALVAIGCSIATSAYGLKMVFNGMKVLSINR